MTCTKREGAGHCGHHQCPYSEFTQHGYKCVELADGWCEAGASCLPDCPHSYDLNSEDEEKALAAFDARYPINDVQREVIAKRGYS